MVPNNLPQPKPGESFQHRYLPNSRHKDARDDQRPKLDLLTPSHLPCHVAHI